MSKMKSDYLKALPAEKGVGAVSEEKLRVMWAISGPFYSDPFRFLKKGGYRFHTGILAPGAGYRGAGIRIMGTSQNMAESLHPSKKRPESSTARPGVDWGTAG